MAAALQSLRAMIRTFLSAALMSLIAASAGAWWSAVGPALLMLMANPRLTRRPAP